MSSGRHWKILQTGRCCCWSYPKVLPRRPSTFWCSRAHKRRTKKAERPAWKDSRRFFLVAAKKKLTVLSFTVCENHKVVLLMVAEAKVADLRKKREVLTLQKLRANADSRLRRVSDFVPINDIGDSSEWLLRMRRERCEVLGTALLRQNRNCPRRIPSDIDTGELAAVYFANQMFHFTVRVCPSWEMDV